MTTKSASPALPASLAQMFRRSSRPSALRGTITIAPETEWMTSRRDCRMMPQHTRQRRGRLTGCRSSLLPRGGAHIPGTAGPLCVQSSSNSTAITPRRLSSQAPVSLCKPSRRLLTSISQYVRSIRISMQSGRTIVPVNTPPSALLAQRTVRHSHVAQMLSLRVHRREHGVHFIIPRASAPSPDAVFSSSEGGYTS